MFLVEGSGSICSHLSLYVTFLELVLLLKMLSDPLKPPEIREQFLTNQMIQETSDFVCFYQDLLITLLYYYTAFNYVFQFNGMMINLIVSIVLSEGR